jgi:SAM-dependent methyltransferase
MLKRNYVQAMQVVGGVGVFDWTNRQAGTDESHSLRRWFASLFAIYETDRMIALDLPWWNVAATREIEAFLSARPGARVFEYGSGASTVWLARRASQITTVEHDPEWLTKFERQTADYDHVTLLHRSIAEGPEDYIKAIDEIEGQFDLIVVDGRHRTACFKHATRCLKNDGIVLFDDSGRRRYRAAIEGSALMETRHYGLSYCVPYPDYTSLLRHGDR